MNLPNVRDQINRDFDLLRNSEGGPGGDITIHWKITTTPSGHDPNLQSSPRPTHEDKQETIRGFIYHPSLHASVYSKFAELKVGDIIIDIPSEIEFSDKENVSFEVNGKIYSQKPSGNRLSPTTSAPSNNREGIQRIRLSLAH